MTLKRNLYIGIHRVRITIHMKIRKHESSIRAITPLMR